MYVVKQMRRGKYIVERQIIQGGILLRGRQSRDLHSEADKYVVERQIRKGGVLLRGPKDKEVYC
jgi:hypothetical protein